jgi:hypothetical protein
MTAPYSVEDACKLARLIQYAPGRVADDTPIPSPDEAITIIREARKSCGFNWITADTAIEVLDAHLKGQA